MLYDTIFWDFNGTILDDVDLCCSLLNQILKRQNKMEKDLDGYRHVFGFPIIEYYKKSGITFEDESFDHIAQNFIVNYQPASLSCKMYPGILEALMFFQNKGIRQVLYSASEKKNLLSQTDALGITGYFDAILGLDNIYAASKIQIGLNFINENKLDKKKAIMIGDTLHDKEVSEALGIDCILICQGHQAYDVLSQGDNKVFNSVIEAMDWLIK